MTTLLRLLPGVGLACLIAVAITVHERLTASCQHGEAVVTAPAGDWAAVPAHSWLPRPQLPAPHTTRGGWQPPAPPVPVARPNLPALPPAPAMPPARRIPSLTPEELAAMSAPAGGRVARPTAFRARPTGESDAPEGPVAVPVVSSADFRTARPNRIASTNAFAAPAGVFTPPRRQDMPPKGIEIWTNGGRYSEKQKLRDMGRSVYSQRGDRYSFGFHYDWSVDSVIGLSCDIVNGKITSDQPDDERRDEYKGYLINAHWNSTIFGKFPFDATFTYGRVKNQTEGWLHYPFRSVYWEEDRHESDLYGLSLKAGLPLMLGNGVKLLTRVGLDYTRIQGKEFSYTVNVQAPMASPKNDAASLSFPVDATFRYDYLQCWGVITPRLGLGMAFEFNDDAMAVRTFNSTAASRVDYVPNQAPLNSVAYDLARQTSYHVTVGVDVLTVGGWELAAEYTRRYSEKFSGNEFKLELAKCF